jgi:hypothetical protein
MDQLPKRPIRWCHALWHSWMFLYATQIVPISYCRIFALWLESSALKSSTSKTSEKRTRGIMQVVHETEPCPGVVRNDGTTATECIRKTIKMKTLLIIYFTFHLLCLSERFTYGSPISCPWAPRTYIYSIYSYVFCTIIWKEREKKRRKKNQKKILWNKLVYEIQRCSIKKFNSSKVKKL